MLKYQRNVYSARTQGKSARFLTVIEAFEKASIVKSVTALSSDHLRVELSNGVTKVIEISGLEGDGEHIRVSLFEEKNGVQTLVESAAGNP